MMVVQSPRIAIYQGGSAPFSSSGGSPINQFEKETDSFATHNILTITYASALHSRVVGFVG